MRYNVLDRGFIEIVDTMGNDTTIVNAARVSYQEGTKQVRDDAKLINYLVEHKHTSPLEMVEFQFQIKAPIFVARQWFRHRVGVSYNEMSLRYSVAPKDYYIPHVWRGQDSKNRQASQGILDSSVICTKILEAHITEAIDAYERLIAQGASREMARMVLPSNLYTTWYWKVNARALAHFIDLRDAAGAQYEIAEYARVLKRIMGKVIPITTDAYEKFIWNKEVNV